MYPYYGSDDYIMRQIEGITRFLAKVLFHQDEGTGELIDEALTVSTEGLLLHELLRLTSDGRVNDAENRLFREAEHDPRPGLLAVAARFYQRLSDMSDAELLACGFSRPEIGEGLGEIRRLCGMEGEEPPQ